MIGLILQARMGSTRLPGKVLKPIGDKLLLGYIQSQLENVKSHVKLVVATSQNPLDDKIQEFCLAHKIDCYRGSEENVLERYYLCAKEKGFSHIVRLTADNPFVDPEEIDRLIETHLRGQNDFTYSFQELPVGVGAEIFTFGALEEVYRRSTMPHHFEHVDEYLLENMDRFKTGKPAVPESKRYPEVRLTVDTEEDYKKALFIAEKASGKFITTERAVELCTEYALKHHTKEEWATSIEP